MRPQEVFDALIRTADRWSGGYAAGAFNAYMHESTGAAPRKLLVAAAQLMAHPYQRVHQDKLQPPFELTQQQ